jgi:hypothetical protein
MMGVLELTVPRQVMGVSRGRMCMGFFRQMILGERFYAV